MAGLKTERRQSVARADSPGKWATWHCEAGKDQTGSLGPVDYVIVRLYFKGSQKEIDRNPHKSLKMANETHLYFISSYLIIPTDYQSMCNSTPQIRKVNI